MSESQKSPVKIALLGCGTVGGGVLRLLEDNRELFASRVGAELQVQHVLVRQEGGGERTVEVTFLEPGAEAYVFTFG